MIKTIQLIRHGKTKGNIEKRFIGKRTDESLCSEGILELNSFLKEKIYENFTTIFSSPMKRCIETANILYPKTKLILIENLQEIDFGIFENKNHKELKENIEYQKWIYSNGKNNIPSGESLEIYKTKVITGFNEMISFTKEEKITAIVHGGTIMALLSVLNNGNFYDYFCKNGRGYIFNYSTENMTVKNLRKI